MNLRALLFVGVLVVAGLFRFLPHPPNMTPVVAISVLSVAFFDRKDFQFGFPILIMLLTDTVIGFHRLVPFVYGGIALGGVAGYMMKHNRSFSRMFAASLLSSIVFFVVSNFGVWLLGGYPNTLLGLSTCYIAALPFFHNTLIATVSTVVLVFAWDRFAQTFFIHQKKKPLLRS